MNFKNTAQNLKNEFLIYLNNISIYIKYQLITKGFLFIVVIPLIYSLTNRLLKSANHPVISSGNIKDVLSSFHIAVFFIFAIIILFLLIIVDISAFITISASIKETGYPVKITYAIKQGIKSIKKFLSPAGVFLIIYTILITPLVGIGLKSSFISRLQIPQFITSVIYNDKLYLTLYASAIVVLAIIGFFLILSFHFMQLNENTAISSIKQSVRVVWKNKLSMITNFIIMNGILVSFSGLILGIMHIFIEFLDKVPTQNVFLSRFLMVFVLLLFIEFFNFCFFLIWPLQVHMLTSRFYSIAKTYNLNSDSQNNGNLNNTQVTETTIHKAFNKNIYIRKKSRHKTKIRITICLLVIFNLLASWLCAIFFDEFFHYNSPDISIVAHRGGGNLAAENTIPGINEAIKAGAKWSEIDVMRSKDGVYIINHDYTFKRLAGVNKEPSSMKWSEIQKLNIKDTFNPSRPYGKVADLNTVMNVSKNKIGLLIELKGKDADKKMADDVVKAIKNKNMQKETIIIALDYNLIKYIEQKYPEIQTGYLYFFAIGDVSNINTDYLMMEESSVNLETIEKIHDAGKKAFVWTVNNPNSITNLIDTNVDGIITDRIIESKASIKKLTQKTDKELILDEINNILRGN